MLKHILSVLAFMIVSFGVQGLNHFVINKAHYATIKFMRAEPVLTLGVLAMVIEGLILTFAMTVTNSSGNLIKDGLIVSLSFGLFLASYIVLAEPAKYMAPSIVSWSVNEAIASTLQFVIYGVVLGLIHRNFS